MGRTYLRGENFLVCAENVIRMNARPATLLGARGRGRAAKALGLDVPPHLQQLADEVIESFCCTA
jgi:hypothetical protein